MNISVNSWSSPPKTLTLSSDEVHVWRASLKQAASCVQSLQQTLSVDEQGRAERFHFQKDREHFIVARGLLRAILSHYLGREPGDLSFCYNQNGKPALGEAHGGDTLRFNLSHSHGIALYAVTQNRDIGVDLEYIRADFPCEQIAERFFSPQENSALRMIPAHMKHQAFFNCWTRKEAYIKATGKGLSIPLDQFDVTLAPGEPAVLLNTKWNSQEACRWSLQELSLSPDYAAAIAFEGSGCQIKCWQWPLERPNSAQ